MKQELVSELIMNILFFFYENYFLILELQLARTCCEDARTIDPYNLDSMDIFSNILFVLVS